MSVSPSDAAVAARSFPRRWRALFARAAGDDDSPDVLERSGAPALALRAAHALGQAAERLHGHAPEPVDDPLEAIDLESHRLAEAVEGLEPGLWDKELLGTLSTAIEDAAARLREAERAVEAVRAG